jgi:hypothetical protein
MTDGSNENGTLMYHTHNDRSLNKLSAFNGSDNSSSHLGSKATSDTMKMNSNMTLNNNNSGLTKPASPEASPSTPLTTTSATATTVVNISDREVWTRGGRQFANPREVYTRSLYRICLKFTTSEDEDEGKPEPSTAFWALFGKSTTIGNGGPSSPTPDNICRRMDESISGPAAGIISRINDFDGEQAALYALRAGMTTGWNIRGDRGDAAIRVGKAKILTTPEASSGHDPRKGFKFLSLDAERWTLCKNASFSAGNSLFIVEDIHDSKQKITIHCMKGPMRGKMIDISSNQCPYIFGRAHEADLCLMDRELSRKHGAIVFVPEADSSPKSSRTSGGAFVLTDLESTVRGYTFILLILLLYLGFMILICYSRMEHI